MSFLDAVSELRAYKDKIEYVYTKTLTAGATNSALDKKISEAEDELTTLDLQDKHSDDKMSGVDRMHRLLEDSMRTNRQALGHLSLSGREKGLKVNAERDRIKREAEERDLNCQELRDVVARDQGEVWCKFPMIVSMGQIFSRKHELTQQISMTDDSLKIVAKLCQQLDAVKNSKKKQEKQLLKDKAKLEKMYVQEESCEEEKESEFSVQTAGDASNAQPVRELTEPRDESTSEGRLLDVVDAHMGGSERAPEGYEHADLRGANKAPDGYESCYESGYDSCLETPAGGSGRHRMSRAVRALSFSPRPAPPKTTSSREHRSLSKEKAGSPATSKFTPPSASKGAAGPSRCAPPSASKSAGPSSVAKGVTKSLSNDSNGSNSGLRSLLHQSVGLSTRSSDQGPVRASSVPQRQTAQGQPPNEMNRAGGLRINTATPVRNQRGSLTRQSPYPEGRNSNIAVVTTPVRNEHTRRSPHTETGGSGFAMAAPTRTPPTDDRQRPGVALRRPSNENVGKDDSMEPKRPRMDSGDKSNGPSTSLVAVRSSQFKPPPPAMSNRSNQTKSNGNVGKNTSASPNLQQGGVVADITENSGDNSGNDFSFFNVGGQGESASGGGSSNFFNFGSGEEEEEGSSSFFFTDNSSSAPSNFNNFLF